MRPDSLLAVVVAGVGRLKDQDESVAGFSFVLVDEILDRLGLVRRVIVQYNMCLLGLQQLQIGYLAAQLPEKYDEVVLVGGAGEIEDWFRVFVTDCPEKSDIVWPSDWNGEMQRLGLELPTLERLLLSVERCFIKVKYPVCWVSKQCT